MKLDKKEFLNRFYYWIDRKTGDGVAGASPRDTYEAVSRAIMDLLWNQWRDVEKHVHSCGLKKAYYFSAEYLIGRVLGNNLINLGWRDDIATALEEIEVDLNAAEDIEPDAALGNGGLGRLAACFMESLATLNLPARGYGIRYRYGMFRQEIINDRQMEKPDDWMAKDDPWSIRRTDRMVIVPFGGRVVSEIHPDGTPGFRLVDTEDVRAIPCDMPVIGWETGTINTLRLWEAESVDGFNLQQFNNTEYQKAVESQNRAKDLTRILYPDDSYPAGKVLRLRQQYFFTSASLQDIIREYHSVYGEDLSMFSEKAVIQLNDTHPVIAIPELMRLLLDIEGLEWNQAWEITTRTFAYTNHTVLTEALEQWSIDLFRAEFPRLIQIVEEINRCFMALLIKTAPGERERHHRMSILADGMIKMAHLAIVASFSINGVAAIHTEILKNSVLNDWYKLWPDKFNNKTNGVTQRRWLRKANPSLASFLNEIIGPLWTKDLSLLSNLRSLAGDKSILQNLDEIKQINKIQMASLTRQLTGLIIDPSSLFDVQIKRLHEYKRQLMNILSVIHDWLILKDNPELMLPHRTIFFGGKAAPGYRRARQIIHLIHTAANIINNDKKNSDRLKVVFIPDYRVSIAEILIPGAEISQQISTAGKEASGTGNMKFMMNGAITLGTMDGANIEIVEEVGENNAFIFGMLPEEVAALRHSGKNDPTAILESDPMLKRALNTLVDGTLGSGDDFRELYDSLIHGVEGNAADNYFVLTDFASYREARNKANLTWTNREIWNQMALHNIAGSGRFSSDRSIKEYADEIWNTVPCHDLED